MSTKKDARWTLRLPPDLNDKIAAIAKREMRTLNSQVVLMLRRSLESRNG